MKHTNKILRAFGACVLLLSTVSCSNWLAVDMEDGMLEDKLYETNEGYKSVLNGVYNRMNENYSTTLTSTVLDVMAQYYDVRQNNDHTFNIYANYMFTDKAFEATSSSVWSSQYAQIANINTLLSHIDEEDSAINENYYSIIKGEAIALRAMLHFDLLRLYGPIYNEETQETITIPYQESDSKEIQPLLSAKDVMIKVINDLLFASNLLENDPIRSNGVMDSDSEDLNENNDMRYRQYRMNYYAVQALLARAYLWIGDKKNAGKVANDLITENKEKQIFPWTTKNSIIDVTSPDLIFSTEVLFGLYNSNRVNIYNSYFKNTTTINRALTFRGEIMNDISSKIPYFYSDDADLRRGANFWSEESLEQMTSYGVTEQSAICFHKYSDISGTIKPFRYMIPLIRMSEVYLIAAECCEDLTQAIDYVNAIRENRNCVNLDATIIDSKDTLQEYITAEFMRETIGEGQLYFYYKRLAMEYITSGTEFYEDWWWDTMELQNYIWPLPKSETNLRLNVN